MQLMRFVTKIGFIAILAISMVAGVYAGNTNEARAIGLQLYQSGKFAEAIPYFDQVLAAKKRDLEILIKRGACYLQVNHPLDALDDFDRVNEYSRWASGANAAGPAWTPLSTWLPTPTPDVFFAENWGNRGIALLMVGRDVEALESFRMSIRLWGMPQNRPWTVTGNNSSRMTRGAAGAYQGFGQAYHRLGQNEQAYEAYSQAIAIDSTDANGFAGRGDVLATINKADAALADYNEAIRLNPAHTRALGGRGILLYDQGQDNLALADLDRALELDAGFAKCYSYRGGLRAKQGQNEQALADYNRLLKLLPENAGAYKDRGGLLVRMQRFDEAVSDLDEAIRLDPGRASSYLNRGAAYNGLGQYERAIGDFTKAIELNHDNAGAYTNRGLSLYGTGQFDLAITDLSEAVRLAPKHPIPRFNRAEVYAKLGFRDRAIEDYDAATQLDPHFSAAITASARLREQIGRHEQAIHDFDMAVQLVPGEVSLYYDRGNAKREAGDWRGALADYDRAVILAPRQAENYVARGWSRLGMGVEGADFDARAFLKLRGWRDPLAPYMAILGSMGARQFHRPADAGNILDEATANMSPRQWPIPVIRYLRGQASEDLLFQAAADARQKAEAHAFLGLDRVLAGDAEAGLKHLRAARDQGPAGSIAADVARAMLSRIEPKPPAPVVNVLPAPR